MRALEAGRRCCAGGIHESKGHLRTTSLLQLHPPNFTGRIYYTTIGCLNPTWQPSLSPKAIPHPTDTIDVRTPFSVLLEVATNILQHINMSTPSAAERVFIIPELLESILQDLHPRDIHQAQRVCRDWQSSITKSNPLQRRMHMLPKLENVKVRRAPTGIKPLISKPLIFKPLGYKPPVYKPLIWQWVLIRLLGAQYRFVNGKWVITIKEYVSPMPGSWRRMVLASAVTSSPFRLEIIPKHFSEKSMREFDILRPKTHFHTLGDMFDQIDRELKKQVAAKAAAIKRKQRFAKGRPPMDPNFRMNLRSTTRTSTFHMRLRSAA